MSEKRKPSFDLSEVKAAFVSSAGLNRTVSALRGARALSMTDEQVVEVIQELVYPRDFDKSMTSLADFRVWQDVYRPLWQGRALYVKFTRDHRGEILLLSFKEA